MNTEKTISNIVEDLQNEAMPFEQYVYEPKRTHQIIRKHLTKQWTLYGVVKRFINSKWVKGFGLAVAFMVILTLTNKYLFTIPDFTCGWISCIGFYLGKDGL